MNIPDSIHEVVAKAPLAHLTRLNMTKAWSPRATENKGDAPRPAQ
jgi:hypothetical protein